MNRIGASVVVGLAVLGLGLGGCSKKEEGTMEKTGKQMDKAGKDAAKDVDKAMDDAAGALDKN